MSFPLDLPMVKVRPNWKTGVRATYEFLTEIVSSEDGTENQRTAYRNTPRRMVTFNMLRGGEASREYDRFVARYQAEELAMPDYSRGVSTLNAAGTSETLLTLQRSVPWLIAGEPVFVQNGETLELLVVSSFTGPAITFAAGFTHPWPKGTKLFPPIRGRFGDTVRTRSLTTAIQQGQVDFEVTPASDPARTYTSPFPTLAGREVFTFDPNWVQGIDRSFLYPVTKIDFGYGKHTVVKQVEFASQMRVGLFQCRSPDAIESVLGMFYRMSGQQGEFYLPTWINDIPLRLAAASAATVIRSPGTGLYDTYNGDPSFKAIDVLMTNGNRFQRKVTGLSTVSDGTGNDTLLTLAAGLPYAIAPDSVRRISWLQCARFATDTLVIDYLTDGIANIQTTFQSLKDLTAE